MEYNSCHSGYCNSFRPGLPFSGYVFWRRQETASSQNGSTDLIHTILYMALCESITNTFSHKILLQVWTVNKILWSSWQGLPHVGRYWLQEQHSLLHCVQVQTFMQNVNQTYYSIVVRFQNVYLYACIIYFHLIEYMSIGTNLTL